MNYTIEEIRKLEKILKGINFHAIIKGQEDEIVDSDTLYIPALKGFNLDFNLIHRELFKDSSVAPINPVIPKVENTLECYWGDKIIGTFSLTQEDLLNENETIVNETIVNETITHIKNQFFWNWYDKVINPLLFNGLLIDEVADLIRPRLNDFGWDFSFIYDGIVLQLTLFTIEPFKIHWTLNIVNKFEKDIDKFSKPYFNSMVYDAFYHIFFNEGNGMNSSLNITNEVS